MLRERLLVDAGAVCTFTAGLQTFLDDPLKVWPDDCTVLPAVAAWHIVKDARFTVALPCSHPEDVQSGCMLISPGCAV